MSDEIDASGPAGGEGASVDPGAAGQDSAPLTVEAAADRLTALESEGEAQPAHEGGEGAEAPPAGEGQPEPETPEEDPQPLDFDRLHGNTKLRLRDGSEVTVAELKKRYGELQEIPRAKQALEDHVRQFQQRHAQFAEQEQQFARVLPLAISVLQSSIPPAATPQQWAEDPVGAIQIDRAHQQAVSQLQALQQEAGRRQQHSQQETVAQMRARVERESAALFEKMPHLKDEKARTEFHGKLQKTVGAAGFSAEEIANISDHRIFGIIDKAIKYDEIMAAKPKPAPAPKGVPPVSPGRRVEGGERRASDANAALQRLRSTGSIDDALAALNLMDP